MNKKIDLISLNPSSIMGYKGFNNFSSQHYSRLFTNYSRIKQGVKSELFIIRPKWPVVPISDRDIDREATEKCKLANKKMAQLLNWDNSEIEQFSN